MRGQAGHSGEVVAAVRAVDFLAEVGAGIEVLLDIVEVLEVLVAFGAIVVVLNLVGSTIILGTIKGVANIALKANMALCVHVLPTSSVAVESCEASITAVSCVVMLSLMIAVVSQMVLEIAVIVERLVASVAEVNHADGD